jgi:hypothetical protein
MIAFTATLLEARPGGECCLLPPPLWGRVGEGGGSEFMHLQLPPSLSLPRKGGGNRGALHYPKRRTR